MSSTFKQDHCDYLQLTITQCRLCTIYPNNEYKHYTEVCYHCKRVFHIHPETFKINGHTLDPVCLSCLSHSSDFNIGCIENNIIHQHPHCARCQLCLDYLDTFVFCALCCAEQYVLTRPLLVHYLVSDRITSKLAKLVCEYADETEPS